MNDIKVRNQSGDKSDPTRRIGLERSSTRGVLNGGYEESKKLGVWPAFKFGTLRTLLDQDRGRKLYELFRDVLKIPTLFRGPTLILNTRHIPLLVVRAIRVLGREGIHGLQRRLRIKVQLRSEEHTSELQS